MKTFLAIIAITLVIACTIGPDEGGRGSSVQNDKNYTVTVSDGVSCSVMIRKGSYGYHDYTLQCPSGTTIKCMRAYDNTNFILGYKSASYGLVAADGYGSGSISIDKGNFESIDRVSLHETICN